MKKNGGIKASATIRPQARLRVVTDDSVEKRLLQSALTVLRRDGFAAFTQSAVAAQADVRQSHLTYYFPTRPELLKGVMNELKASAVAAVPTAGGKLNAAALSALLCADLQDSFAPRLMLALTAACDEDESLRPWLAAFESDNKKQFQHALGLPIESFDLDVFHATVAGAKLINLQQGTAQSAKKAARIIEWAIKRLLAQANNK